MVQIIGELQNELKVKTQRLNTLDKKFKNSEHILQAIEDEKEMIMKVRQNLDPQKLIELGKKLNSASGVDSDKERPKSRDFRIRNGGGLTSFQENIGGDNPDQQRQKNQAKYNMEDSYALTKK